MTTSHDNHLVIMASAGSGKTFRLTNRYIARLASKVPVSQVWAATFTRKAAGEILQRMVERLAKAAEDVKEAAQLAEAIGKPALTRADFVPMLRGVLNELHRLRIGTLDSLFIGLAGAFPLELGLPPGWGIVEEHDAISDREEALDAVLTGNDDRVAQLARLYERLAPGEAKRAIRDDLLARIDALYQAYLTVPRDGWQTAAPKAPEGSAAAIFERARSIPLPADKRFGTTRDSDFEKAASEQWSDFLAGGLMKKVLEGDATFYKKPIPPELVECYQQLLAFARFAVNRDLADSTAAVYDFLDQFHQHFAAIRTAGGGLRFDDVARALAERLQPAAAGFDYRIDGRISHLLLDEFQDTSTLQWRVLEPLARQAMASGGSVFAVGDVKQAIYGWRGGRSELLENLPEMLGGVSCEEMHHSRRSAKAVIECVNKVFGNIAGCVESGTAIAAANAWRKRFQTHTTARTDRAGFVHIESGPAQVDGESTAARRERHYEWVAERIKKIYLEKPKATIGVLCRKNPTVGRMIYELRQLGIPASEEGGNPIDDSPAVEGILSLLTLADHPGDTIAAFHLAAEPFATVLRDSGYDPANPTATSFRLRTALIEEGYGPVIADWAAKLKAICPASDGLRLDQLTELADAYQPRATLRPADFVSLVRQHKAAALTASRVRVLTLHKAKGLEYDAVVLPELDVWLADRHHPMFVVADQDPPRLPHGFVGRRVSSKIRPLADDAAKAQIEAAAQRAIEESFSLLYVALTRPREALYAYVPGPTGERKDCWDTLLLKALRPEKADAKSRVAEDDDVFTAGDAKWEPEKHAAAGVSAAAAGPIRFGESDPSRKRAEWVAPSQQEGGRRIAAARLFEASDPVGRRVGTLHHAWFAAVEWLDESEPTDDELREVARRLPYEGADLAEQMASFRTALQRPVVRRMLSKSTYPGVLRVERERPFAVRVGDRLVGGRIDRLVWQQDERGTLLVEVIDFKTDAIPAVAVPERVAYYRPQIEAYLRAVAAFAKLPTTGVSAALIFTVVGHVEPLAVTDC